MYRQRPHPAYNRWRHPAGCPAGRRCGTWSGVGVRRCRSWTACSASWASCCRARPHGLPAAAAAPGRAPARRQEGARLVWAQAGQPRSGAAGMPWLSRWQRHRQGAAQHSAAARQSTALARRAFLRCMRCSHPQRLAATGMTRRAAAQTASSSAAAPLLHTLQMPRCGVPA